MSKEFKHFSKAGLNFFTLNQANLFMLNGQMKQQKYTLKCSNIIFLQSININGIEEFDEAINCADIILNINTQHYQSFAQKAQSLMKLGKFNEAIIQIEKALSIKQKDQKLIIIKGKKYFKGIILKQICNFHAAIKWLTLADNDQQSKTLIEKLQTLTMMMSNIKQLFNLQNNFQLKSFTLLSNWLLSM
ncbi:unnamed protein product [Paramecium sonneborni]|uniref:Tetratricopeptide repeat protein n=1 Tax=Paramecium sonneborni TaxID=65129 RepID=A0A8S1KPK4_9CILI|nr:unnamed protein product [Paramecium sonneborni]